MIKALFFDLDGTLLSSGKTILPSTRDALLHCREKGVRVYLATARSPRLDKMLHWTDAEFALFDGGLYCNGSCVVTDGARRYAYIDPAAAEKCAALVGQFAQVHMSLHMEGDLHAFNHHLPDEMLSPWGVTRDNILPLDAHAFRHAVKILIYHSYLVDNLTQPLPIALFPALKEHCGALANIYLTDEGRTIQLAGRETSKYAAIQRLRKDLGLAENEIAVFGDDLNDMEMLSRFPNSVAMGNGHPQTLAAAAHVTLSNDRDGIAHALKEIFHLL